MKKNLRHQASWLWALTAFILGFGLNHSLAIGEVSIPLLKTTGGDFRNVKVFSRTSTHLSFSHEKGTAVIKVSDIEEESVTAIEQSNAGAFEAETPVPGAVVMLKTKPTPKPDPAWLVQSKQMLGKLNIDSLPFAVDRMLVWKVTGGLLAAWWFYSLCCSLICKKTGHPGGLMVWLPVFQVIPMFRAARMSGWWFLALFIPLLNLIAPLLWCVKITQARGKGFFTAAMLILPGTNLLAFIYLAFSNGRAKEEDTFTLVRPPHALAVN